MSEASRTGPLPLAPDEPLLLHIFIDCSVIEVFANYRLCMSCRVYPSRSDSLGVGLFARGGNARLKSLDVWEMESIRTSRHEQAGDPWPLLTGNPPLALPLGTVGFSP